ncbi:porin, partial [bacterium M00.F.Ca.ET.156.01.1.1]
FEVDTRTDTELGALRGFIGFRGNADNGSSSSSSVFVDQAFIELGGLKVGKFYSWWDDDLNGETDILSTNTLFNSIKYTYDAGSFQAALSVDELEGQYGQYQYEDDNNVGIGGMIG